MEQMIESAYSQQRALNENLMEKICEKENLNKAYKRVKSNAGASGIDGMQISKLAEWIKENKDEFIKSLLNGTYKPSPVKGIKISKPSGGKRLLGIPTCIDRLVQQAILQVVDPIFDPFFSNQSDGFRKGRGAHKSLLKAKEFVKDGHMYVVDIDLEKFFDTVNHDMIMARLARRIKDKCLLRLIRSFLKAGMMIGDQTTYNEIGTPQGGPLSPLLSNLLLDDLDKELEKRGHKFVRYADDCNIYLKSEKAASRVMESLKKFIERKLHLKVNLKKTKVSIVNKSSYLGYTIKVNGSLTASKESIKRFKDKIRGLTSRRCGKSIENVIAKLNQSLRGWITYFRLDGRVRLFQDLDSWIRRRLRCLRLKQRKRSYSIAKWLITLGVDAYHSWCIAKSSKGWWRLSKTEQLHKSLNNAWFIEMGLLSLHKERVRLQS
jgi:RNA-directed DNA polymerase